MNGPRIRKTWSGTSGQVLNINEVRVLDNLEELITLVLSGETAILFAGYDEAYL